MLPNIFLMLLVIPVRGVPTFDRLQCGGEIEPKNWPCSYAGGSLSVTPVFGGGDCPADWSEVVVQLHENCDHKHGPRSMGLVYGFASGCYGCIYV